MSELWLIAHKVRGEAAFDVATQMECPECGGDGARGESKDEPCDECLSLGFWWIIPTSGHRAYPWWHGELNHVFSDQLAMTIDEIFKLMPKDHPDHYATRAAPKVGLAKLIPQRPCNMTRRV